MLNTAMVKYSKFKYKLSAQLFFALFISLIIHAAFIALPVKKTKLPLNNVDYAGALQINIHRGQGLTKLVVNNPVAINPVAINPAASSKTLVSQALIHKAVKNTKPASITKVPKKSSAQPVTEFSEVLAPVEVLDLTTPSTPSVIVDSNSNQPLSNQPLSNQNLAENPPVSGIAGPTTLPFAGLGGSAWSAGSRPQPPQGNQNNGQMQAMMAAKRQRMNSAMSNLYSNLNQNKIEVLCALRLTNNSQMGYLACDPSEREGLIKSLLGPAGIIWDESAKKNYEECLLIKIGAVKSDQLDCKKSP